MSRIRVLVVDDSLTARKHLVEVLASDPHIEVVGEAACGRTGIDLCQSLRPDIVTLDMMMPGLSGLAVTEHIMAYCPTPILIVSASFNRGEIWKTLDALAAGAIDVLEKPHATADSEGEWRRRFLATVKLVSRIKVVMHPRRRLAPHAEGGGAPGSRARNHEPTLVGIGASTGGPEAVAELLRALPSTFSLPILLVIHVGGPLEASLAEWLGMQSGRRVVRATDGAPLPRDARVVMAPADRHMIVRDGLLHLTRDPERHSCRPSVDVLFESLAREVGARAIGCLLTGMGRDGALGLLGMKKAGATTLVQDEATSVVFGMPREAIAIGAADQVLPLGSFAPTLAELAGTRRRS